MRITEAAQRLGTSPRMLRYRDLLGLLPQVRERSSAPPATVRAAITGPAAAPAAAARPDGTQPAAGRPGGTQPAAARTAGEQPDAVRTDNLHLAAVRAANVQPAAGRTANRQPAAVRAAGGPAGAHSAGARPTAGHRRFSDDDLAAVALALRIEQRYDITPAALAFGLRVLTDAGVRADVAELGRRIGRIGPPPARALDFEKQRALRLLSLGQRPRPHS